MIKVFYGRSRIKIVNLTSADQSHGQDRGGEMSIKSD